MMIACLVVLLALSAVSLGQDCGGNPALACMDDGECVVGTCFKVDPADFLGCCTAPPTTTTAPPPTTTTGKRGGGTDIQVNPLGPRPAACVDLLNPQTGVSDCPARSYLCGDAVYRDVMRQQCPRTCNYCTGPAPLPNPAPVPNPAPACVDLVNPKTGVSDCPGLRSYCNNAVYVTLMRQQCRRTCGFC